MPPLAHPMDNSYSRFQEELNSFKNFSNLFALF